MSIEAKIKSKIIKDFAIKKGDTGSPEVQVALLTYRQPWEKRLLGFDSEKKRPA
jgi:hypothetical protein